MEENVYNNYCFKCGETFQAKGKWNSVCPDCEVEELYQSKTMANWTLIEDNEYIYIIKETQVNRKTPILHICSKLSRDEIGIIKWYGAWRKFCFFPYPETIWDEKCLMALNNFLIQYNKDWREKNGK